MRIALIKKTTLGGSNGGSGLVMYPSGGTNYYTVDNIAEFDNLSIAQAMATNMNLLAVSVDDLPITIGDTYSDGRFYRGGQEVTQPEDIAVILQQLTQEQIDLLRGCVLELSEELYGGM